MAGACYICILERKRAVAIRYLVLLTCRSDMSVHVCAKKSARGLNDAINQHQFVRPEKLMITIKNSFKNLFHNLTLIHCSINIEWRCSNFWSVRACMAPFEWIISSQSCGYPLSTSQVPGESRI